MGKADLRREALALWQAYANEFIQSAFPIEDRGKPISELWQQADDQARDMASSLALSNLPRRYRRVLGDRGHRYGFGEMKVPKSR